MIMLAFLGFIAYLFLAMKIIDFVLDRTKTPKGALLALACGLLPLVFIIQLLVSLEIVK